MVKYLDIHIRFENGKAISFNAVEDCNVIDFCKEIEDEPMEKIEVLQAIRNLVDRCI